MISITSLIYRSTRFADAVWESCHEFTPHLSDGRARFFFVANDATPVVLEHLKAKGYPHVVQTNEVMSEAWMTEHGFGWPEYIRRVYQGWNRAVMESEEICVLVNSDMMFSPGWLDNLLKHLTAPKRAVVSQLVEPRQPFDTSYKADFGLHPGEFRKADFLTFADERRKPGTRDRGVYMPLAMYRQTMIDIGLYPEGNLHGGAFHRIKEFGDANFMRRLREAGGEHLTALDSIVYHFHEGEMRE